MTMDEKLDLLLVQSESTNKKILNIEHKVNKIENKVNEIENKVNEIENKVNEIENKVNKIENKVNEIELTLENETNRNIYIIAEGHLDLSRKLDGALKSENEKEMLSIRFNSLENEVRKMKAKMSQIA